MAARPLSVVLLLLALAGCAAAERPALAPDAERRQHESWFLPPGFMGGFDGRVNAGR